MATNLKADRDVVLAAVNTRHRAAALQFASEELRDDRAVVLTAVEDYGSALEYASEMLRADREVVLAAVENHGSGLKYASERLRANREVVLTAVENNGSALKYASKVLQVVLAAISERRHFLMCRPG